MSRTVNPKEREAQKRRILASAKSLFAVRGYNECSLKDIADAAEMGKSSLYYYFHSKEEVYREIILNGTELHYKNLTLAASACGDFGQMIEVLIMGFLNQGAGDMDLISLLYPSGRHAPDLLSRDREVQELFTGFRLPLMAELQRVFPDHSAYTWQDLAQLIWTYHSGLAYKLLRGRPSSELEREAAMMINALRTLIKEHL